MDGIGNNKEKAVKNDYSDFIQQAKTALGSNEEAIAYLRGLGLKDETIVRCNLGFNEGHIIVPYNGANTYYMKYAMDSSRANKAASGPAMDNSQGIDTFYNSGVLKNGGVIFVVESAFCALSIFQCGGRAIAINTSENVKILMSVLEAKDNFDGIFILSLNNDPSSKANQKLFMDYLAQHEIPYIDENLAGDNLTPNEMLQNNPDGFLRAVGELKRRAQTLMDTQKKADNVKSYLESKLGKDMQYYIANKAKLTGYEELDKLSGGLQAGVYILGGLGSSGKTTFLNQMSDQIAQSGEQVLYFSMEQSILGLVSKSVAREAYLAGEEETLTSVQLRTGESAKFNIYLQKYYNRVSTNLSIIECEADFDMVALEEYVDKFIKKTQKCPVVVIDYYQAFGGNVSALRRLSRKYKVPILVAYGLPRKDYTMSTDLEKFADVEYSADVIWVLQLKMLTEDIYERETEEKSRKKILDYEVRKSPRLMQLMCLKNRYGSRYSVEYEYFAQNDCFKEATAVVEELTESAGAAASYKNSQIPEWVLKNYQKSLNKD